MRKLYLASLLVSCLGLLNACASYPQSKALISSFSENLPRKVTLEKVPFFPQELYQCGPSSLATMLTYRGIETNPEQLKPVVYVPEKRGSLPPEMLAATRYHGLLPYLLDAEIETVLQEIAAGNPVLILQNLGLSWWPVWHYAVVTGYDIDSKSIQLNSGTTEALEISLGTFERSWASNAPGWALVVTADNKVPASASLLKTTQAIETLVSSGKTISAESYYRAAIKRWPQSALLPFARGNLAYSMADYALAKASYIRSLQLDSASPDTWNNLAYALATKACDNHRDALNCALWLAPEEPGYRSSKEETDQLYQAAISQPESPACPSLPSCPSARATSSE